MASDKSAAGVSATVSLIESAMAGTVETTAATETNAIGAFLGITFDPNDVAGAARIDRAILFGFANLGIAHFQAGTPSPVKK